MLSFATVLRLVQERKCIKSARPLELGEFVVGRLAFPLLYGGGSNSRESDFLLEIFSHIPALICLDDGIRNEIRDFMQIVLRNGSMHSEDFLHRYLYEFWADIDRPNASFAMQESFYKCQGDSSNSVFMQEVVKRVHERGKNVPDILGRSNTGSVLIVEIKNEDLDDRALGQVLRYYQLVRNACDRYFVNLASCNVVPILIAPSCSLGFWNSIPFHFREVLEIYYWRISSEGKVYLVDGKQCLRDSARMRLFQSS
jgi:hypothetical protein